MGILICGLWIFSVISLAVLYERADEHWWAAIVPVYNRIVNYDIALGDNGIVAVAIICDIVRVLASFFKNNENMVHVYVIMTLAVWVVMLPINGYMYYNLGRAFGRSKPWCIAMIFLGEIMLIPMALDSNCTYVGPKGVKPVYKTLQREENDEN